jgi:calcineurin-like phosphoesterase family protein
MFIDSNKTKIFFTSDLHFGHKNIIKYCERPYQNVDEMNIELRTNWNLKVGKNDVVFVIGDFAFAKEAVLSDLIWSLNGKIYLVPGNHDNLDEYGKIMSKNPALKEKFVIVPQLFEVDIQVEDEKLRFVCCHYAMRVWNKSHYGSIQLYGHSHGTLPDDPTSRSMDVGVDCNEYSPLSLDDVLLKMYRKVYKSVDHHGDEEKQKRMR